MYQSIAMNLEGDSSSCCLVIIIVFIIIFNMFVVSLP